MSIPLTKNRYKSGSWPVLLSLVYWVSFLSQPVMGGDQAGPKLNYTPILHSADPGFGQTFQPQLLATMYTQQPFGTFCAGEEVGQRWSWKLWIWHRHNTFTIRLRKLSLPTPNHISPSLKLNLKALDFVGGIKQSIYKPCFWCPQGSQKEEWLRPSESTSPNLLTNSSHSLCPVLWVPFSALITLPTVFIADSFFSTLETSKPHMNLLNYSFKMIMSLWPLKWVISLFWSCSSFLGFMKLCLPSPTPAVAWHNIRLNSFLHSNLPKCKSDHTILLPKPSLPPQKGFMQSVLVFLHFFKPHSIPPQSHVCVAVQTLNFPAT